MSFQCDYSFADLYRAGHGREPDTRELAELLGRSRAEINAVVKVWAEQVGRRTREVIGADGATYESFWQEDVQ